MSKNRGSWRGATAATLSAASIALAGGGTAAADLLPQAPVDPGKVTSTVEKTLSPTGQTLPAPPPAPAPSLPAVPVTPPKVSVPVVPAAPVNPVKQAPLINQTGGQVGTRLQQTTSKPLTGTVQRLPSATGSQPSAGRTAPSSTSPLGGGGLTTRLANGGSSGGGNGVAAAVAPGGGAVPAAGPGSGLPPGGGTYVNPAGEDQALRWQRVDPAGMSTAELAAAVASLSGCFYALGPREQRVLTLRGGLGGRLPLSRGAVARRLGLAPRSVRALEIRGLRRLQGAAASDGCAGSPGTTAMASTVGLTSPLVASLAEPIQPEGGTAESRAGGPGGPPALAGPVLGRVPLDGEGVRWELLAPILVALGILSGLALLLGGASRDERERRRRGRPVPATPLRARTASPTNGARNGARAAQRARSNGADRVRRGVPASGARGNGAPAEGREGVRAEGDAAQSAERRGAGVGRRTAA